VTNRDKLLAELIHKYLTYLACGFNAILVVPAILWLLGVGRLGCWTGQTINRSIPLGL